MSFATTARVAPEKQDKPACLPLVSSMGGERAGMDEVKLNWDEAEEDGCVLVNAPCRKVAVFANTAGEIALVTECDGQQSVTTLAPQEAIRMVAMLRDAIDDAMPTHNRIMAEFSAFEALSKAAGVVNGN